MPAPSVQRPPRSLGPRGQRWFDVGLTAALLFPVLFALLAGGPVSWAVLGLLQVAPLFWRRHRPCLVFAAVAVASAAQVLVLDQPIWGQVAFPIATYSVARYSRALPAAVALAVALVAAVVASYDWLRIYNDDLGPSVVAAYVLPIAAIVITAWALGTLGRTRRAYVDTLVERGERIEREAAQQVAIAASEERARIAREMHDVVAHGLSVIVVQADGARYAAEHDPRVATDTLERIAATGREALGDMRQLLGLLRGDELGGATPTGRSPLPTLADLPALVADAGATAQLGDLDRLDDLDRPVPPAVALTAYRVVQEALTNVRKHAGPDPRPTVHVRVTDDALEVRVDDAGRGAAAHDDGQGHGLRGMRERVDVHDGSLATGPRPGGGYRVTARLPL